MRRIIYVNFPYLDNREQHKARPALCLTRPLGKHKVMVVAFITTKHEEELSTDVFLAATASEFRTTGLKRTSYIHLHKLYSVVADEVVGEVGILPEKWDTEVQAKLRQLFSLA